MNLAHIWQLTGVTFHRLWPRKYGWLNFAILECSLNVWIVNKTVFAAPELREKCAAQSEVFSSLPKMTSHKSFWAEISNINIFHITAYFRVKSCKRNQCNLPNILAYISGIFDDFFEAGIVPLTRAPLGYFYNAPHWGGGAISRPSPLWSPKLLGRF